MSKVNPILYQCRNCNKKGDPKGGISFKNFMHNLVRPNTIFQGRGRPVFGLKCPHCGSTSISPTSKEAGEKEPLSGRY